MKDTEAKNGTATVVAPLTPHLALALLMEAPDDAYVQHAEMAAMALRAESDEAAVHLERFAASVAAMERDELEETFLRTFSVAPSCVAYVGVHLYGEGSFKRGELLARLSEGFGDRGFVRPTNELPDQLSVLLRFADHLAALALDGDGDGGGDAQAELDDLELWLMAVPTRVMVEALRDTGNPFFELISAVFALVARDGIPEEVVAAVAVQGREEKDLGCSFCSETQGDLLTGDPLDDDPMTESIPPREGAQS